MVIIVLASLIFAVIFIKFIDKFKNDRFYELLKQFPSYPAYPLIGNLNMLRGSLNDLLGNLEKITLPHDRVFFWLGPFPILFLKKYDDIATVLAQSEHRDLLGFGEEWIGIGLLNAKYKDWKISKKVFAPAFSTEMLSQYVKIFQKNALALVDTFKPTADSGEIIDVWEDIIQSNIDSILEIIIGAPMERMEQTRQDFSDGLHEGLQSAMKQVITPWLQSRWMYHAYLKLTGRTKFLHQFRALPTKILQDKLKEYRNGEKSPEHAHSSKCVIDQLIKESQSQSSFTETRIATELTQLIITAIGTTALNLSFSMLMLALHQDIQQKVYEEIEELFEANDSVTADHIFKGLKYMEQCIKETTRIFSHIAFTTRRTYKECILKDNKIIPANTFVVALLFLANLDPDVFENPHKWNPENFSEHAVKNRPKNSFMSFGSGPRSCIGIRYTILSIKTQIAYILREYHLSTDIKEFTEEHLTTDLCKRSKLGYPIKFTKRKNPNCANS